MILARVIGNLVCTEKNSHYVGRKLLYVQPITPAGDPVGSAILAVDGVQAGEGETVVVFDEGGSARQIIGSPETMTIRTVVGAIVDKVTEGE